MFHGCTPFNKSLSFDAALGSARMLGTNLYGLQLRGAPGVLEGFDSVFGREPAHNHCHLAVGCHVDGRRINSLNIFRDPSTTSIHFHKKFDVLHGLFLPLGIDKQMGGAINRLPSLSLARGLCGLALGLGFEDLLAANVNLDLLRLGFVLLGQP